MGSIWFGVFGGEIGLRGELGPQDVDLCSPGEFVKGWKEGCDPKRVILEGSPLSGNLCQLGARLDPRQGDQREGHRNGPAETAGLSWRWWLRARGKRVHVRGI